MLIVELVQHWGQENDKVEDLSHREEAESAVIV